MNDFKMTEQEADQVLARFLIRLSYSLTHKDLRTIDILNRDDPKGEKVKNFLIQKIPNIQEILKEELLYQGK